MRYVSMLEISCLSYLPYAKHDKYHVYHMCYMIKMIRFSGKGVLEGWVWVGGEGGWVARGRGRGGRMGAVEAGWQPTAPPTAPRTVAPSSTNSPSSVANVFTKHQHKFLASTRAVARVHRAQ